MLKVGDAAMTVKEIAEICGVSEQSVRNWCNANKVNKAKQPNKKPCFDIDEVTKDAIIQHFKGDTQNKPNKTQNQNNTLVLTLFEQQIETLKQQIDSQNKTIQTLTEQLTAKDNQIQALQQTILSLSDSLAVTNTALTQAQTLHALTIKADSEAGEPTATEQAEQTEPQEKKKGFFKRFKRK